VVDGFHHTHFSSAMGAAKELSLGLDPMPDDLAPAVIA
jgi:hypothetical protein